MKKTRPIGDHMKALNDSGCHDPSDSKSNLPEIDSSAAEMGLILPTDRPLSLYGLKQLGMARLPLMPFAKRVQR